MKLISARSAISLVILSTLFAAAGCGDDESSGTGGAGGASSSTTTTTTSASGPSTPASSTTDDASSSSQGGGGTGGDGTGGTGTGGDGTGGDGTGGSGTGGSGTGGSGTGGSGTGGGGTGGGSAFCAASATTVDLQDVVARATTLLEDTYGTDLGEPAIYFQDGLNAVGFPAPNDMGAIVVAFEAPEDVAVFEGELLVYRAQIWGTEELMLASVQPWNGIGWDADPPAGDDYFWYYAPASGLGGFAGAVSEDDAADLGLDFETAFPGSSFIPFVDSGIFIFTNVEPASLGAANDFLLGRKEIDYVEPDGEVYATDFGFGPRVDLAGELASGPIDVYEEHAFLSQWLRKQGAITYDAPTLPKPFGPGPLAQSPTQRYEPFFLEGSDPDACLASLAACGFETVEEDGVTYLVDPSYVAATILRSECIDYLMPQLGDGPV